MPPKRSKLTNYSSSSEESNPGSSPQISFQSQLPLLNQLLPPLPPLPSSTFNIVGSSLSKSTAISSEVLVPNTNNKNDQLRLSISGAAQSNKVNNNNRSSIPNESTSNSNSVSFKPEISIKNSANSTKVDTLISPTTSEPPRSLSISSTLANRIQGPLNSFTSNSSSTIQDPILQNPIQTLIKSPINSSDDEAIVLVQEAPKIGAKRSSVPQIQTSNSVPSSPTKLKPPSTYEMINKVMSSNPVVSTRNLSPTFRTSIDSIPTTSAFSSNSPTSISTKSPVRKAVVAAKNTSPATGQLKRNLISISMNKGKGKEKAEIPSPVPVVKEKVVEPSLPISTEKKEIIEMVVKVEEEKEILGKVVIAKELDKPIETILKEEKKVEEVVVEKEKVIEKVEEQMKVEQKEVLAAPIVSTRPVSKSIPPLLAAVLPTPTVISTPSSKSLLERMSAQSFSDVVMTGASTVSDAGSSSPEEGELRSPPIIVEFLPDTTEKMDVDVQVEEEVVVQDSIIDTPILSPFSFPEEVSSIQSSKLLPKPIPTKIHRSRTPSTPPRPRSPIAPRISSPIAVRASSTPPRDFIPSPPLRSQPIKSNSFGLPTKPSPGTITNREQAGMTSTFISPVPENNLFQPYTSTLPPKPLNNNNNSNYTESKKESKPIRAKTPEIIHESINNHEREDIEMQNVDQHFYHDRESPDIRDRDGSRDRNRNYGRELDYSPDRNERRRSNQNYSSRKRSRSRSRSRNRSISMDSRDDDSRSDRGSLKERRLERRRLEDAEDEAEKKKRVEEREVRKKRPNEDERVESERRKRSHRSSLESSHKKPRESSKSSRSPSRNKRDSHSSTKDASRSPNTRTYSKRQPSRTPPSESTSPISTNDYSKSNSNFNNNNNNSTKFQSSSTYSQSTYNNSRSTVAERQHHGNFGPRSHSPSRQTEASRSEDSGWGRDIRNQGPSDYNNRGVRDSYRSDSNHSNANDNGRFGRGGSNRGSNGFNHGGNYNGRNQDSNYDHHRGNQFHSSSQNHRAGHYFNEIKSNSNALNYNDDSSTHSSRPPATPTGPQQSFQPHQAHTNIRTELPGGLPNNSRIDKIHQFSTGVSSSTIAPTNLNHSSSAPPISIPFKKPDSSLKSSNHHSNQEFKQQSTSTKSIVSEIVVPLPSDTPPPLPPPLSPPPLISEFQLGINPNGASIPTRRVNSNVPTSTASLGVPTLLQHQAESISAPSIPPPSFSNPAPSSNSIPLQAAIVHPAFNRLQSPDSGPSSTNGTNTPSNMQTYSKEVTETGIKSQLSVNGWIKPPPEELMIRRPVNNLNALEVGLDRITVGESHISEYILQEKLGEGTFGIVWKGIRGKADAKGKLSKMGLKEQAREKALLEGGALVKNGDVVALKAIIMHNESDGMPITSLREIRLLKSLKHPNIVPVVDMAFEHGAGELGKAYMVFPYMEHDLTGLLENTKVTLREPDIKQYAKQLIRGTLHLHQNGIIHRDMKAANLLINNAGVLMIADFGLARSMVKLDPTRKYTNCVVTRWYRPPELLLGEACYDYSVDMWGVGCVLAEMFKKKPIFPGDSDLDQAVRIFKLCGPPTRQTMPNWENLPGVENGIKQPSWDLGTRQILAEYEQYGTIFARFLDKFLVLDPKKRITALEASEHEWINSAYPLPTPLKDMPTWESSHELDKRNREEEMKGTASQAYYPPAPIPRPSQLPRPSTFQQQPPYGGPSASAYNSVQAPTQQNHNQHQQQNQRNHGNRNYQNNGNSNNNNRNFNNSHNNNNNYNNYPNTNLNSNSSSSQGGKVNLNSLTSTSNKGSIGYGSNNQSSSYGIPPKPKPNGGEGSSGSGGGGGGGGGNYNSSKGRQ